MALTQVDLERTGAITIGSTGLEQLTLPADFNFLGTTALCCGSVKVPSLCSYVITLLQKYTPSAIRRGGIKVPAAVIPFRLRLLQKNTPSAIPRRIVLLPALLQEKSALDDSFRLGH